MDVGPRQQLVENVKIPFSLSVVGYPGLFDPIWRKSN